MALTGDWLYMYCAVHIVHNMLLAAELSESCGSPVAMPRNERRATFEQADSDSDDDAYNRRHGRSPRERGRDDDRGGSDDRDRRSSRDRRHSWDDEYDSEVGAINPPPDEVQLPDSDFEIPKWCTGSFFYRLLPCISKKYRITDSTIEEHTGTFCCTSRESYQMVRQPPRGLPHPSADSYLCRRCAGTDRKAQIRTELP